MNFLQGLIFERRRSVPGLRVRSAIFMAFTLIFATATEPLTAYAQDLRKVKVTWQEGNRTKLKSIYCQGKTPGEAKGRLGSLQFTAFSEIIRRLKSSSDSGTKLVLYKRLQSLGKPACKLNSNPGGSPTATPTPPPISTGNFDNFGNVTERGKIAFGIPSNLSANITSGKNAHTGYCSGCHEERLNRTFSQLRTLIAQSPMLYDDIQIPDEMLADITAYLNRFRAN